MHNDFVERLENMWMAYTNEDASGGDPKITDLGVSGTRDWKWILSDIDADLLYSIFLGGAPGTGIACRENFETGMAREVQEGGKWT